jgi:hypothetical protein
MAIAGRLTGTDMIEPDEFTALKEALRALRQLISETKASRTEELDEKKGAA